MYALRVRSARPMFERIRQCLITEIEAQSVPSDEDSQKQVSRRLLEARKKVAEDEKKAAENKLTREETKMDGCENQGSADSNDMIVDCDGQAAVKKHIKAAKKMLQEQ